MRRKWWVLLGVLIWMLLLTACPSRTENPVDSDSGSSAQGGLQPETGRTTTSKYQPNSQSTKGNPADAFLPDLTAFLNRRPAIEGRYHGGYRVQYKNLPVSAKETVTTELLTLLKQPIYQLELKDEWVSGRNNRAKRYDFTYTGTHPDIQSIQGEDEAHWFDVQLTIYYDEGDEEFSLQLHFCQAFTVKDPGTRASADVSGGSAGGSSGGSSGDGVDVPQFAKLDCLTCRGDGDCTRCGGDGYTGFGDAKAGCNRCHGNGKCTACNGTGKRN